MGDFRDRVNVRDIAVGISKSLKIDRSCVVLDRAFYFFQVVGVNKSRCNAVLRKCMGQQIEASAIDRLLCYDVAAVCRQCLNCISDRSCAG